LQQELLALRKQHDDVTLKLSQQHDVIAVSVSSALERSKAEHEAELDFLRSELKRKEEDLVSLRTELKKSEERITGKIPWLLVSLHTLGWQALQEEFFRFILQRLPWQRSLDNSLRTRRGRVNSSSYTNIPSPRGGGGATRPLSRDRDVEELYLDPSPHHGGAVSHVPPPRGGSK